LKTKSVFVALILAAMASSIAAPRASAQEFNLRAAHYFKEDHPWNKALVSFARCADEGSQGKIKIDIFNGGHEVKDYETRTALQWFRSLQNLSRN